MRLRNLFPVIADGGPRVHCECRECGQNLSAEADYCPGCDGEPVQYEVQ